MDKIKKDIDYLVSRSMGFGTKEARYNFEIDRPYRTIHTNRNVIIRRITLPSTIVYVYEDNPTIELTLSKSLFNELIGSAGSVQSPPPGGAGGPSPMEQGAPSYSPKRGRPGTKKTGIFSPLKAKNLLSDFEREEPPPSPKKQRDGNGPRSRAQSMDLGVNPKVPYPFLRRGEGRGGKPRPASTGVSGSRGGALPQAPKKPAPGPKKMDLEEPTHTELTKEDIGDYPVGTYVNSDDYGIGQVIFSGVLEIKDELGEGFRPTFIISWFPRDLEDYNNSIECTEIYDSGECIRTGTCSWNEQTKLCTKKKGTRTGKSAAQLTRPLVSDITYREELADFKIIPAPGESGLSVEEHTIPDEIAKYLQLLSLHDQIKDFFQNTPATGKYKDYREKQKIMVESKIKEILESRFNGISSSDKDLFKKSGGDKKELYARLEEQLGIISINPYTILHQLLPNIDEEQIHDFIMLAFILHHLNSRESAEKLKDFVKKNKDKDSNEIYNIIFRWYKQILPDTFVWVEASSSLSGYDRFIIRLKKLAKIGKLHTMVSPASHIDAAGIESFVSGILKLPESGKTGKTKDYTKGMGNGNKKRIVIKDTSGNVVFSFIITCVDKSTNKYVLQIEQFYDLDCKQFGSIPIIGTSISTINVWEKLFQHVFTNTVFDHKKLIEFEKKKKPKSYIESFEGELKLLQANKVKSVELDLCLKANKTTMDMLKGIYAINFTNDPAHSSFDSIGVFNDKNSARTYMAMSKKGVALYSSSTNVGIADDNPTSIRVIVKRDILEKALSAKSGARIPESQTLTDPEPEGPQMPPSGGPSSGGAARGGGGPVDEGYRDYMQTRDFDEEALIAEYERLSVEFEELKRRVRGTIGSSTDAERIRMLSEQLEQLVPIYEDILRRRRRGGAFGKRRTKKVANSVDRDIAYLRSL